MASRRALRRSFLICLDWFLVAFLILVLIFLTFSNLFYFKMEQRSNGTTEQSNKGANRWARISEF